MDYAQRAATYRQGRVDENNDDEHDVHDDDVGGGGDADGDDDDDDDDGELLLAARRGSVGPLKPKSLAACQLKTWRRRQPLYWA